MQQLRRHQDGIRWIQLASAGLYLMVSCALPFLHTHHHHLLMQRLGTTPARPGKIQTDCRHGHHVFLSDHCAACTFSVINHAPPVPLQIDLRFSLDTDSPLLNVGVYKPYPRRGSAPIRAPPRAA